MPCASAAGIISHFRAVSSMSIFGVPLIILFTADMRKALPRDTEKKSVVPLSHPVMPEDLEW